MYGAQAQNEVRSRDSGRFNRRWVLEPEPHRSLARFGVHNLSTSSARRRRPLTVIDARLDLAQRIAECCRLTGTFVLRSGQTASTYFDKYQFEGDPSLLREVAAQLAPLVPEHTDVLAGLELGGVPVATALSLVTGLPTAFVRKEAKTYGTARLAEGAELGGRRVLVVEDVITTGGQVTLSTGDLRALGAQVDEVLCVIDRSSGERPQLDDLGLSVRSLFTIADLES
jgi:orotate phosphoribosyltransferase